jgi:hypothetical protein
MGGRKKLSFNKTIKITCPITRSGFKAILYSVGDGGFIFADLTLL